MSSKKWEEGLRPELFAATVLYLLRACRHEPPGVQGLLKMLWYADFWHYRTHLKTITGARYVALKNGPVVDDYKGLLTSLVAQGLLTLREIPIQGREYAKMQYEPLAEPDVSLFSESETETLQRVVTRLAGIPGHELSLMTHKDGPWLFAWDEDRPGQHIPYISFRWLDNLPDEDELHRIRADIEARPEVMRAIATLNAS